MNLLIRYICWFCIVTLLIFSWGENIHAQDNKPKLKVQTQSWHINFDEVWTFKEGFAVVKKNNKWGYVDANGIVKIPLIYDKAYGFIKGVAWVVQNGKNRYINKNGDCVKNCR